MKELAGNQGSHSVSIGMQLQAQNGFPGHFCFRFSFVLDALTQVWPDKHRVLFLASFFVVWEVKREWGSGLW